MDKSIERVLERIFGKKKKIALEEWKGIPM